MNVIIFLCNGTPAFIVNSTLVHPVIVVVIVVGKNV
jgi:hypothetical protein